MAGSTVKEMTTNFGKLDKFEGHDFKRWQKKMHFLLTTLKVVYVLSTPMPELLEDDTVEAIRRRAKWENDDYMCGGHILNGMSNPLFDIYQNVESAKELWDSLESKYIAEDASSKKFFDFKHSLKHGKDDLSLVQLGSHLHIKESLRVQESNKGKGKEVSRHWVNMIEEGAKNKNNKQNKGKKRCLKDNYSGSGSNKQPKLECWKCGKTRHFKRVCSSGNKKNNASASGSGKGVQGTTPRLRLMRLRGELILVPQLMFDRCWFKTYEPVKDGFVLYMGDDHFARVHRKGSVVLKFSSEKSITLFNVLYVPKHHKNLISGHVVNKCGYKHVYESDNYILSKSGVFVGFGYYNNGMFMLSINKVSGDSGSVYMSSSTVVNSSVWHARLGHVHYKRMLKMSKDDLIHAIDENPGKCNKKYVINFIDDATRFCYVYLLHGKDEALEKYIIYKTKVELQQNNLIKTLRTDRGGEYYDPAFFQSVGIIHETIAPYTPQRNGVAERKNRALREMVNYMLSYSGLSDGFWGEAMLTACYLLNRGCRAVVMLPDAKRKTFGEKGIDCIFVGYAEHSKAYQFYVIEPNDSVSINTIIESKDEIFDENRFSSIPRPKDIIPNLNESQWDDHSNYVPSETSEPRKVWHARLGHVHYKRMLKMSKDDLIHDVDENPGKCNKKYVINFIDDATRFCYVYLLHGKDEALEKYIIYKTKVELQQNNLIKTLRTDRGGEYYDPAFFQSVGIIHETIAPYTPQRNGVAERKNRALREMVNYMLSYSGLSDGFWGEAMLTACYLLNRGCRAVVMLPDAKRKTFGEKGIDCIFVGYAEHSKAYQFYVIEPNDSVSINTIIESKDEIFDENRFSSIPRPKDIIPNLNESQWDDHSNYVPSETSEPRK
nr:hypothetical protein [Tanacetum cinerariifolium]